jgi:lipopolysaccharide export system protein LptA
VLNVPRLRRWFALAALVIIFVVAGVYYKIHRGLQDVLKQVPNKIGVEIQQTAQGFKVSKSLEGRTLFTLEASKAVQFKEGGHTELHNVTITLYGRDSSRYDKIQGDDFEYDPQSGDVIAKGEVRIDLEANPEGVLKPDQSAPSNLRNPIHLVTSGLIFNQKTGNAYTHERVNLTMPQATGSAIGVDYNAKDDVLHLGSQVHFVLAQAGGATVNAVRGAFTKTPRQITLDKPHVLRGAETMTADQAVVSLSENNTLERVVATGDVLAQIPGSSDLHGRADTAVLEMTNDGAVLNSAMFSGNVQIQGAGTRPFDGFAGRVLVSFSGKDLVNKVRAEESVKLIQKPSPSASGRAPSGSDSNAQEVEVTAPAMDFSLAGGQRLDHAETSAGGAITLRPADVPGERTVITAGIFKAKFAEDGHLSTMVGAPDARIVNTQPGQPERTSTSRQLDIAFASQGGIASVVQQGDVAYQDGDRRAWADRAVYTPTDQVLVLTGSPRVSERGMTTIATTMRMNRATGDANAEGNVKSTYSELHEQPTGALLASSSPIHVTSRSMTAHQTPSVALYTGNVRLWQDADVVQAPSIEFDQVHRSIVAKGDGHPVSTVLSQVDNSGRATLVTITSDHLLYTDDQHVAKFDGNVVARSADIVMTAARMDAYLKPRGQPVNSSAAASPSELDRIVAQGKVLVQEPERRATGDQLVYTAADDKFVMTGGPPSIFDAEHGKITGDSLTFYKRDDRVLVEGKAASPTVTTTRVAR